MDSREHRPRSASIRSDCSFPVKIQLFCRDVEVSVRNWEHKLVTSSFHSVRQSPSIIPLLCLFCLTFFTFIHFSLSIHTFLTKPFVGMLDMLIADLLIKLFWVIWYELLQVQAIWYLHFLHNTAARLVKVDSFHSSTIASVSCFLLPGGQNIKCKSR